MISLRSCLDARSKRHRKIPDSLVNFARFPKYIGRGHLVPPCCSSLAGLVLIARGFEFDDFDVDVALGYSL
jgi:hypothetical protein